MALTITRKGSDPFKKYWWVVLLVFLLMGAWTFFPALGGGGSALGSNQFFLNAGALKPLDQSLDVLDASAVGASAPGNALGKGAAGAGSGGGMTDPGSMLYQPLGAGNASASAAPRNLADALGAISRRPGGARTPAEAPGPAASYSIPSATFAPIAGGMGSGGSSAGSFTGGSGLGAFGTVNAQPEVSAAQGMGQDMAALSPKSGGALSQLQAAAGSGAVSNGMSASAAQKAVSGAGFDGNGTGGVAIPSAGGGMGFGTQGLMGLAAPAPESAKMNGGPMPPVPSSAGPSKQQEMLMMLMMVGAMGLMMAATGGSASMMMPMMAMQMMPMMMGSMMQGSSGYGGGYGME